MLWILCFPTKNFLHDKNQTFSTRVFTSRFFSYRFSWPFKDFQDSTPKIHVRVQFWFPLVKQCISVVWFPNSWSYTSGRKCIVAMFSCLKTKSEKEFTTRGLFISAMSHVKLIAKTSVYICHKNVTSMGFLQLFESFHRKIDKKYLIGNDWNGFRLRQKKLQLIM